jgi:histidinol-phosphate aminotransferase
MKSGKIAYLNKIAKTRPIKKSKEKFKYNLSNNESAFGKYRHYPDTWPLYKEFAKEWNVSTTLEVLPTNGAEEALSKIYSVYTEEGSKVLRADPCFGMIEVYEAVNNAIPIKIPYNEELDLDWDLFINTISIYSDELTLIYLALPDNPTGHKVNSDILYRILQKSYDKKIPVIVDCTYYRFIDNKVYKDILDINKWNNLIIVDSLSKSHGLAGLRVGAIIASKELLNPIRASRSMVEVSSMAVKKGCKALRKKTYKKNVNQANKWKAYFLKHFPNNCKETFGNFIILKTNNNIDIYNLLKDESILTRVDFTHPSMKYNTLRISIGNDAVMKKIVKIIKKRI